MTKLADVFFSYLQPLLASFDPETSQIDQGTFFSCLWMAMFLSIVIATKKFKSRLAESCTPWIDEHISGMDDGGLRAAVFGFSDGLVSNVCLILGVYVSTYDSGEETKEEQTRSILLSGLTGLLAGACSMACGEWVSMVAQKNALETELKTELGHITKHKLKEKQCLVDSLIKFGLTPNTASQAAEEVFQRKPENILPIQAQLVLGIEIDDLGSPWKAAACSYLCFTLGAVTPVVPWLFMSSHTRAFQWTAALVGSAILAIGSVLSNFSHQSMFSVSLRQFLVVCICVLTSMGSSFLLVRQWHQSGVEMEEFTPPHYCNFTELHEEHHKAQLVMQLNKKSDDMMRSMFMAHINYFHRTPLSP
mmetsp:Transcript_2225/g.4064  ORF Transcript_2225/g.4064 Transcript_2225/m.4064 type:complete len:362 (+) Transcript_2225:145-1230(+)